MKTKRVSFTLDGDTYSEWQKLTEKLVSKRYFRNKTEVFETLIVFLSNADKDELLEFKLKQNTIFT
jgi:hypothetical protein